MSTKPYHPDNLVLSMAVLLLNDAPHQRDLYADYRRPAERIHTYIQDAGYADMANAFLAANARAFAVAYHEETMTLEWTPAQSAAVARLVRVEGLTVEQMAEVMNDVRLFRYNLDESATVEALEFCLQATNAVMRLIARPDVATAAGR